MQFGGFSNVHIFCEAKFMKSNKVLYIKTVELIYNLNTVTLYFSSEIMSVGFIKF